MTLPCPLASRLAARPSTTRLFWLREREMIRYFDEMPTLPRLLASRGYRELRSGQMVGRLVRARRVHARDDARRPRSRRPARRPGARDRPRGDAAGLRLHRHGPGATGSVLPVVCADDAPFAAQSTGAILASYRDKAPTLEIAKYWAMCEWFDETCGQLLDFLDSRKLADEYARDLPGRQRLDPGSGSRPIRAAIEAIALRRRAQDADPGPLAGQGRAADVRHAGQRDRHRPHGSESGGRGAPSASCKASTCSTRQAVAGRRPSSARSSRTTRWTSTTPHRAFATAGSWRVTGS